MSTCPHVHMSTGSTIHRSTDTQVHRSIYPEVQKSTCTLVHLSTCPQVSRFKDPQVPRSTGPQVHRCTGAQVSRFRYPQVHRSPVVDLPCVASCQSQDPNKVVASRRPPVKKPDKKLQYLSFVTTPKWGASHCKDYFATFLQLCRIRPGASVAPVTIEPQLATIQATIEPILATVSTGQMATGLQNKGWRLGD